MGKTKPSGSQKCDFCHKEAVVFLPYSLAHMCSEHFCASVEKRFKRTVREFHLLKKGDHVAVGLSGGKDSTVLLHLLKMLSATLPLKLSAITIDEGIAGYRSNTMKVAVAQAKKLKVPLFVQSFKKAYGFSLDEAVGATKTSLPCSYCGVFRRQLLNIAAKKLHADKLAIGHNLDDMAQTYLMNILRNDRSHILRFNRLGDVAESGGFTPRIKPLAQIPEKEIALYAILKELPIHFQECPNAHHAYRQKVRDMLNSLEESYPGTKNKVFNAMHEIGSLLPKIDVKQNENLRLCKTCGEPTMQQLCSACKMVEQIRCKLKEGKIRLRIS